MLIGNKVHELRKARNMSLTELSKKSGVQMATLSRIENMKMTGTLDSHMDIAKALDMDITELYKNAEKESKRVDVHSSKGSSDVFVHNDLASYEILTNNVLSKRMMPMLIKIESGGRTNLEQNKYGAEKFLFVLEGKLTVKIGSEAYSLSKNSTLYFDASVEHYLINEGKSTVKVLCTATPVSL